ncbi:NAD(P)/FAD-dependent oxidoreductase [Halolamina salifodinae]|uniref:NADH dehydrogenase n=1 Tax=Halolamina salifodinae TaxID=1202767 RepID=A0A8T4GX12_9EURY|nr:FAD-dependent oxidoreductase [Halolamina salifodinae]MBP1986672.1 NADH dehydrogenase [Halolamina salifodinae]
MTHRIVVVGAGYAGTGTVDALKEEVPRADLAEDVELVWINEEDYHLVLHESHRVIRDPSVASKITIPCESLLPEWGEFRQGRAVGVDTDEQSVELDGGETVDYDHLLLGIGSATAFYGIDGLREHSLTLKGLADAREIHQSVKEAAADASIADPAQVIVGGAGLSGIQAAGEIAAYRDEHDADIDVHLVEGLDEVFPGNDDEVQQAIRTRLEDAEINIECGEFISKVDEETVYLGGGEDEEPDEMPYDVLVWTGGITGQEELENTDLDKDERSRRVFAAQDFRTSDDRVFAIGDTALIDQGEDNVAPPTAVAAWTAAEVAGENLVKAVQGKDLSEWTFENKGTLISVGDEAVAHDIEALPFGTFGGTGAKFLKKAAAVRWIASISSFGRGMSAWSDM